MPTKRASMTVGIFGVRAVKEASMAAGLRGMAKGGIALVVVGEMAAEWRRHPSLPKLKDRDPVDRLL